MTEPLEPNDEASDVASAPERIAGEDAESRERAAEADDTLAPGTMPGGPDYPEEATEGPERDEPGAPAH